MLISTRTKIVTPNYKAHVTQSREDIAVWQRRLQCSNRHSKDKNHKFKSFMDKVTKCIRVSYRIFPGGERVGGGGVGVNVDVGKGRMCASVHPLGFCRFLDI